MKASILLSALFFYGLCLKSFAAPAVNGTTGNYPFPQNRANPNGVLSSLYNNADVLAAYNKWYADCVVTVGAATTLRVQRPNDSGLAVNSTVSEGIGYGMVIAVYMNDQALFDGIWKYEQSHKDGSGLMNWYILSNGTNGPNGNGAATDADEDMAWALLMAARQWGGSGSLGTTYLTLATNQINAIYTHEVSGGYPVAGDGFPPLNPSYFAPAYYREFASATGQSGWNTVAANCYTVINNNLSQGYGNTANGLVSAWCDSAGVSQNAVASAYTDYQYDACRTPFRIAEDYLWFGTSQALTFCQKTSGFFQGVGAVSIVDGYHLDGTKDAQLPTLTVSQNPGSQSAAFVGPAGVGGMVSNSYGPLLDGAYGQIKNSGALVGGTYYDESWTVMSLLMMSGNFLDYRMITPGGTPTNTRTATPPPLSPTQTRTPTPTSSATSTMTTTSTATRTMTKTTTDTVTSTPSPTETLAATNTSTLSPTPSRTETSTVTSTTTRTATASPTSSPTATGSPSSTATKTFTSSTTSTGTASPTGTLPPTLTATMTVSFTNTPTRTPTFTPSNTSTVTASNTPSGIPTFTQTRTPSSTPTSTSTSIPPTATPTRSATPTLTATFSVTPSPTRSSTTSYPNTQTPTRTPSSPTPTMTSTAMPPAVGTPVLYPDPNRGGPLMIQLPVFPGSSDVRARIFTVAFKLVAQKTFQDVPSGDRITMDLLDRSGQPLANGLYYIQITIQKNTTVEKLMVSR